MTQTATQVGQYGITWEFDGEYTVGQYADGDWWVEGPVTITTITPESTEVDGRVTNGTMLDPVGYWQGFDSYDSDMGYEPDLNVDPGATGEDLVVDEGSVVSSVSLDSPDSNGRPVLSDLAILTVVTAQPSADAFRPGPYSEDKAAEWTESDLDYGVLRSLPVLDSAPDLDTVTESVERFWNEQETSWQQRAVHAKNNQETYGREIAYVLGDALLSLHLDYPEEDKRDLFVNVVQRGIDIYDRASVGGVWEDNCGHNPGRKMPMLFAGLALGADPIVELARAERPREEFRFQEDRQTFIVSEEDIENPAHTDEQSGEAAGETDGSGAASGTLETMPVDPETLPPIVPDTVEFAVGDGLETIPDDGNGNLTGSGSATGTIDYEDGSWTVEDTAADEPLEVGYEYSVAYTEADLGTPEWGCQYTRDGGDSANSLWKASYRWIGSSFMHHGLTAHVMDGAVEAWNHPPFFEYLDRYVENNSPSSASKNDIQPFAEEFWNEYRTATGPVTVTASGDTIPRGGTATLSLDAESVQAVLFEGLWTDWTVTVDDPAGATVDDRVGDAGELELGWDTVQAAATPSITVDPPGETYGGGTYGLDIVAEGDGDSATDTALVEIQSEEV